jgi:hypothetical protein
MLIDNHHFKSVNKKFIFYHRYIFRNFANNEYLFNIFSNSIYKILNYGFKKIIYTSEILLKTEFILKATKFKNNYKIISLTIKQRSQKTIRINGQKFSNKKRDEKIRLLNEFLACKSQKVLNKQEKFCLKKIHISSNSSDSKFFDRIEHLKKGTFLNRKKDIKKKFTDILMKIMKVFQMSFKILLHFSNLNRIIVGIRQKMVYKYF